MTGVRPRPGGGRRRSLLGLLAAACLLLAMPAAAARAACGGSHWVGAWAASPSDASGGSQIEDLFAPSELVGPGDKKLPVIDQTVRVSLTPTYAGSTLRVHLSNRFGAGPVTFTHVTVGRQSAGAALDGAPVSLRFGGRSSVTVPAGQDAISDPASLNFAALQTLEVSVFVAGDAGMPTEHYTGRQATYYTLDGAGDHAADTGAGAYVLDNSVRPFVDGLDVLAPGATGAVVAFGDSITDGYQAATAAGVPASPQGYDLNQRWPDDLARRLQAAHIPLAVLNAGISGNRILRAGSVGKGPDVYGPSALNRLRADVLDQAGVSTVIWLEGINDIGQIPSANGAEIEAGYRQGIAEMHAAGLRVLQGTLTPAGSDLGQPSYSSAAAEAEREQINHWILTQSPADGVIDFARAVADPGDPSRLAPADSGADGLHPNPTGYAAMAAAVPLAALGSAGCAAPRLRLSVHPARVHVGQTVRLVLSARADGHRVSVPGLEIRVGARRVRVRAITGQATLQIVFRHPGRVRVQARAPGCVPVTRILRVFPRSRAVN